MLPRYLSKVHVFRILERNSKKGIRFVERKRGLLSVPRLLPSCAKMCNLLMDRGTKREVSRSFVYNSVKICIERRIRKKKNENQSKDKALLISSQESYSLFMSLQS